MVKASRFVTGLFQKDDVTESRYDVKAGIKKETESMLRPDQNENSKRLGQIIKIMRENKHFKEFFLQHEASLKTGLQKLDKDANDGKSTEYFTQKILKHLRQSNKFRKINETQFANMKDETRLERSMDQIKEQKKQVLQSLGQYRGKKGVQLNRLADKDMANYLSVVERSQKVHSLVTDKEINLLK